MVHFFYNKFPRQLSIPNKFTVATEKEFFRYVDKMNAVKEKLYGSLYDCNIDGDFSNCMIDKIGLDLDANKYSGNNQEVIDRLLASHKALMQEGYYHLFKFSTGGFWMYIFTKNYEKLKNKKSALKNSQKEIAKICNLTIGKETICDIDHHIIGDIARVSRIFNTYDTGRKMFTIPITIEDLQKGYDFIKQKAKKQCYDFKIYGNCGFDISKFDFISENVVVDIPENINEDYTIAKGTFIEDFPPCIKRAIFSQDWKGWWLSTLYMKEIEGFPQHITDKVMKFFLSKECKESHKPWGNDYVHYRKHDRFPEEVYRKDFDFPRCDTIYFADWNDDGEKKMFCQGKCKMYCKFYKGSQEKNSLPEVTE